GWAVPGSAQTELVVAGYGGSFETIFKQKLAPTFEKKCSCKVNFISGNSTETVARVQAQKDNPQIDVTFVDDGPAFQGQALGLWGSGRVYALADTGFRVEFVYPKEGARALAVTMNVVKGAKNKRLANEFINAMLDQDAQQVWADGFKFGPYNKNVKLPPELAA